VRCNDIYLFKKYVIAMGLLISVGLLLLCCIAAMDQPRPSLLCDHCGDWIVVTGHLPVAIMGYDSLVQRCIVVVLAKTSDLFLRREIQVNLE
jgi:hypothetical protein